MENTVDGMEGFTLKMFTEVLGWSVGETRSFVEEVRRDLRDDGLWKFVDFWVVCGRKGDGDDQAVIGDSRDDVGIGGEGKGLLGLGVEGQGEEVEKDGVVGDGQEVEKDQVGDGRERLGRDEMVYEKEVQRPERAWRSLLQSPSVRLGGGFLVAAAAAAVLASWWSRRR